MPSTYLSRTISSGGNRKIMTFSAWIKRATASATSTIFATGTGAERDMILFESDGKLQFSRYNSGYNYILKTNRQFRDTNSWYHLVCVLDTTQGTSSNRAKIYVNGVQETSFDTATYPSQDYQTNYNQNTFTQYLGQDSDGNFDFDGCMSHVHYIDGTAYTASTFGSTDATTGEWKINTSPSVTYGTNGFFLLKDDAAVTDRSGEGNNFTLGAGTLTKTEDSPSNLYATNNVVDCARISSGANKIPTYSNGANTVNHADSGYYSGSKSSIGVMSGKWYVEAKITAVGDQAFIGLAQQEDYSEIAETYLYEDDGTFGGSSYASAYGGTHGGSANDIIQIAFDATNGAVWFGLNGTWQNSATVTEIQNGTTGNAAASSLSMTNFWHIASKGYNGATFQFNYGNGFFGTTEITTSSGSGFQDSDGNGRFYYQPPTNFLALCTDGLNS